MIDYALEALNRSKVEEVFLFATNFVDEIKDHVKYVTATFKNFQFQSNLRFFSRKRIQEKCSWSIQMSVQIVGSDGCYCLGDALRDLYAKQLLRKHFILLSANTITNANLYDILRTHM